MLRPPQSIRALLRKAAQRLLHDMAELKSIRRPAHLAMNLFGRERSRRRRLLPGREFVLVDERLHAFD